MWDNICNTNTPQSLCTKEKTSREKKISQAKKTKSKKNSIRLGKKKFQPKRGKKNLYGKIP